MRTVAKDLHVPLQKLVRSATSELLVCSPFISIDGTRFVTSNLSSSLRRDGRLAFLTNLSVANVCQLATDPRALKSLVEVIPESRVFHIPGLHAKVYIADNRHAIVTSGNLTAGGLFRNFEYGVEIKDSSLIRKIRHEVYDFSLLGTEVPKARLVGYCEALERVCNLITAEQYSAQREIRQQFKEALQPIEDELLRLRLAGGAVHTVFARTIEYLLRSRGPLLTTEIHPLIESIHPDLCDNTVDRVIDGKRFGRKWKHAVRTAQQQLKKQGRIRFDNGKWFPA